MRRKGDSEHKSLPPDKLLQPHFSTYTHTRTNSPTHWIFIFTRTIKFSQIGFWNKKSRKRWSEAKWWGESSRFPQKGHLGFKELCGNNLKVNQMPSSITEVQLTCLLSKDLQLHNFFSRKSYGIAFPQCKCVCMWMLIYAERQVYQVSLMCDLCKFNLSPFYLQKFLLAPITALLSLL